MERAASSELPAPKKGRPGTRERLARIVEAGGAECTGDLVAFDSMFESGLALDALGRWSRTLEIGDTAYEQETRETQDDIYDKMCRLHAALPPGSALQINLVNMPERRGSQARRDQLLPVEGSNARMAREFNALIERKQAEGRTEFRRRNLVTFSMPAEDDAAAELALSPLRENIAASLSRMQVSSRELDGEERMRVFHELLRGPEEPFLFDYSKVSRRSRARDFVAPAWAAYPAHDPVYRRSMELSEYLLVRTLRIAEFGSELSDAAIRRIRSLPVPMNISLLFLPQPKEQVLARVREVVNVTQGEIQRVASATSRAGGDPTDLPPAMEERRDDTRELLEHLVDDDQQMSWFQGLITIYASTPEEMRRYQAMVIDEAQVWSVSVKQLPLWQEDALVSAQPVASTRLPELMRSVTTSEAAIMMPWTNEMVYHDPRESFCFVQHANSLAPLFVSPDRLKSPHTMIFGMTGGGKGMLVNTLISHMLLSHPRTQVDEATGKAVCPDEKAPQIIVFDQHGEYAPLAREFDAPIYKFRPGGEWRLNPFDVQAKSGEPLTMNEVYRNADFFLALAADVMEGELTKIDQSIIDRCLNEVFRPHLGKDTRPTLEDFHRALERQPDEAAREIALAFEGFSTGLMSSFNGQTNVEDAPHLTIYDCSELGTSMQTLALLSAMQHVRNVTFANCAAGRPTYAFFEEVQVLFDNDAAVRMLDAFYGELRKFGLHMVCLTQHPTRVLEHPRAKHLFENTGLLVFLPMQNHNADYIEEEYRLSATQREIIDVRSEPGRGLLIADGAKIPFNARIDKKRDAYLYDLFNTDPGRAAEPAAPEAA